MSNIEARKRVTEEVGQIPWELPGLHPRSRAMGRVEKLDLMVDFVPPDLQLREFGEN